jgi:hypothetical protein
VLDVTVRLVSAFFENVDHGVNEISQGLPHGGFMGGPPDPLPPIVAIVSDAGDEGVAAELDPPEVPALMVWGDSSVDISLKGYKTAKDVILAAAFITDDTADALTSIRACDYVLRATRITLGRFNNQSYSAGYRSLNGVTIHEVTRVEEQRITGALGRRKLWGFLRIHLTVVETLQ